MDDDGGDKFKKAIKRSLRWSIQVDKPVGEKLQKKREEWRGKVVDVVKHAENQTEEEAVTSAAIQSVVVNESTALLSAIKKGGEERKE